MTDMIEYVSGVGEWIVDNVLEIGVIAIMILCLSLGIWAIYQGTVDQQRQIDLCTRAFEYTRDQCEFIVRNHIQVIK